LLPRKSELREGEGKTKREREGERELRRGLPKKTMGTKLRIKGFQTNSRVMLQGWVPKMSMG
jgi:hypothetical protein